jgi:hypothetical protein
VTSREVSRRPLAIKASEICAHGVAHRQRSREQLSLEQRRIRPAILRATTGESLWSGLAAQ